MILDTHWPRLFGMDPDHALQLDSERTTQERHTQRCVRWFIERDREECIVARYRCWTSRALQAPWREQLGWERYAVDGSLLVREVRYGNSRRPAAEPGGWLN